MKMGFKLSLSEILENAAKKETKDEKIAYLQQNKSSALLDVLKGIFDPRITFLLPEGDAPFKPSEQLDEEGILYKETRRLYLFAAFEGKPMAPEINNKKREILFIQLLQMVTPKDAELLVAMKDKRLPKSCLSTKEKVGLTKRIIELAFTEDEIYTGTRDKDFDPVKAKKEMITKFATEAVVNSTTYAAGVTIKPVSEKENGEKL